MDRTITDEIAKNLIEQAKQMSKEKFLAFAEEVYGTDRDTWEHLWKVPVVPMDEYQTILPVKFSSISEEKVLEDLERCIFKAIGNKDAVFIPFEDIMTALSSKATYEYESGIREGSISEEYNAVIVYDEEKLKDDFSEHVKYGSMANPPRTQEEINEIFLNLITEDFLHERIHLNANALVIDSDSMSLINGIEEKRGENREDKEEINDDNEELINFLKKVIETKITKGSYKNEENNNEVLIDTMAKIIQIYSKGDTVEDCLYRVIESRDGKSAYEEYDDRLVLSLFTLFPDELSKWVMFEAYEEQHDNLFMKKYAEVFGKSDLSTDDEMFKKVGEYFNQTAPGTMTAEQLSKRQKMLEMIGVKNIDLKQSQKIDVNQMRTLATSEPAMQQLAGSFSDIKSAFSELQHPNQKGNE